jgi:hypothetical protein
VGSRVRGGAVRGRPQATVVPRWESNPHELGSSRDFEFGLASGRIFPIVLYHPAFSWDQVLTEPIIGACGMVGAITSNRTGTVWAQRLLPPRRKPEFWLAPSPPRFLLRFLRHVATCDRHWQVYHECSSDMRRSERGMRSQVH